MASSQPQSDPIRQNITNDDWDAIIHYSSLADWATNDPSNAATAPNFDAYYEGTYHAANVTGASLQYEFKGTDLYVYGVAGPSHGSYSVSLDGNVTNSSAYAQEETIPYLLFSATNLTSSANHVLNITNLGSVQAGEGNATLIDYIQTTVELAPAGATLTNTTVEDNDPALVYSGTWGNNTADVFSGGTTHYTSQDGASVSLSFFGSAVYMWGDSNNDHGYFNVTLDGHTDTYRPPNGCGGRFDPHQCEKLLPSLKWYAAYLNESEHHLTLTNVRRNGLETFFDLDRITYTTPSSYLPASIAVSNTAQSAAPGVAVAGASSTSNAVGSASELTGLFTLLAVGANLLGFVMRTA